LREIGERARDLVGLAQRIEARDPLA